MLARLRIISILLVQLLLCSGCTSFLFFPSSKNYTDERHLKYKPSRIYSTIYEEMNLENWYFEAPQESRLPVTVIFAHGNGQNMTAHFRSLYWTLDHGINFLIVGYPGYFSNPGAPTPESAIASVTEMIKWVKANRPGDKIAIFGQSLGGNLALTAASRLEDFKYCALVIEGSFLSYKEAAKEVLSSQWFLWPFQWLPFFLVSDRWSINLNYHSLPHSKYLVIHGSQDQIIPLELGQQLFEKLPHPKYFWKIEGGRHIDTFSKISDRRKEFIQFLKESCL